MLTTLHHRESSQYLNPLPPSFIVNPYNQKPRSCNISFVKQIAGCKFITGHNCSTDDQSNADNVGFDIANQGRSDPAASALHPFPTGMLNKSCTDQYWRQTVKARAQGGQNIIHSLTTTHEPVVHLLYHKQKALNSVVCCKPQGQLLVKCKFFFRPVLYALKRFKDPTHCN